MAESTVGLDEGSTTNAGCLTDGSGYKAIKHVPCYDNGSGVPVNVGAATPLPVIGLSFTGIETGSKNITTAGTREVLSTSTACKKVTITAKTTNAGKVYYGGTSVSASSGAFIFAGQTVEIEISNLNLINLDVDTSGEGVQFTYFT